MGERLEPQIAAAPVDFTTMTMRVGMKLSIKRCSFKDKSVPRRRAQRAYFAASPLPDAERTHVQRGEAFVSAGIVGQRGRSRPIARYRANWEEDLILGFEQLRAPISTSMTHNYASLCSCTCHVQVYRHAARVKNGPALAGHGADAVRDAITRTIITLPEQLRRSLTWDQGAEMAQHARLKIDTGVQVYFCDPHSPWQRGTNENTNGLLRQYLPKGTDLSMHSAEEIAAVAAALNSRPRKTLDWKTPAEALDHLLLSAEKDGVAASV